MKPRIAIFDFGCCEGCQLQIVNLEERILDLVGLVDVVSWREAVTGHSDEYDIAIVEGSITREAEMERLRGIRENAKVLVALGACAHIGGVNCLKNFFGMDEVLEYMQKGVTAAEHVSAGRKVVESGMCLSEYVMPGLGGRRWSERRKPMPSCTMSSTPPPKI